MPEVLAPAPKPKTELAHCRILSTTAGLRVSPLCLGAMNVGDAWSDFLGSMDKEQAFRMLDFYVSQGGNFIDTANNYQNEQSETWLGEWMALRGNREQIVLATKYTSDYRSHDLGKNNHPNCSGNHRRSLRTSLAASLRKLQTDFVDILYVHWWDYSTSIPEIMDSLHAVVQSGQVMYLGISDTPAWLVSAANTYAEAHGRTPFSIYQGRWNVLLRDMERDIIPMARHFGMAIAPWDALGGGKFQSAKQLAARKAAAEPLRTLFGGPPGGAQTAEEEAMSAALAEVAEEHGVSSVTTIALAYVRAKAPRVFPVLGGRKPEHWKDNIQALSLQLTEAQVARLESVKPFEYGFPHSFIGRDPLFTGEPTNQVQQGAQVDYSEPLVRQW